MEKVEFSIIAPCYNEVEYIQKFVDSVYSQDFIGPFELIIAD